MGPRAGLEGRKISSPPGIFLDISAFIPISIYSKYIVPVFHLRVKMKGAPPWGQQCVLCSEHVSNQLWKDIHSFR